MEKTNAGLKEKEHSKGHEINGQTNDMPGCHENSLPPDQSPSIFQRYFAHDEPFIDRFEQEPGDAVDVVIPVMHTNEVWRQNLLSIYREIPVKRLLLGDAGCIDDTLQIAADFPRVTVLDHRAFVSLGYSIRKLIETVETDWFVYLHSDVYLPPGWFDTMKQYRGQYDWYECPQHLTVLIDFPLRGLPDWRAFSGSQMGRTAALQKVLPRIDDDYLYRNEDIIIAKLIEKHGYRYGRVDETFHYHQQMMKKSIWKRQVSIVDFHVDRSRDEEVREYMMQAKGIVKYLDPFPEIIPQVQDCVRRLIKMGEMTWNELEEWVETNNPKWAPHLCRFSLKRSMGRIRNDAAAVWYSGYSLCRSIAALLIGVFLTMNPVKILSAGRK